MKVHLYSRITRMYWIDQNQNEIMTINMFTEMCKEYIIRFYFYSWNTNITLLSFQCIYEST